MPQKPMNMFAIRANCDLQVKRIDETCSQTQKKRSGREEFLIRIFRKYYAVNRDYSTRRAQENTRL